MPLSKLLDHFEHAVKVAGIDHVGLGTDFDGVDDETPAGMEDASKIPNLVAGLMDILIAGIIIAIIAGGLGTVDAKITDWAVAHNRFFEGPNSDLLALLPFAALTVFLYLVGREVWLAAGSGIGRRG